MWVPLSWSVVGLLVFGWLVGWLWLLVGWLVGLSPWFPHLKTPNGPPPPNAGPCKRRLSWSFGGATWGTWWVTRAPAPCSPSSRPKAGSRAAEPTGRRAEPSGGVGLEKVAGVETWHPFAEMKILRFPCWIFRGNLSLDICFSSFSGTA